MEPLHGKCEASKFVSEDVINSMPTNVIADILDRLPIQDAVKTSILSRNWRFNWTILTQLIFDENFFEYLLRTKGQNIFYRRVLNRLLLHLKGVITKFVLYIPGKEHNVLDVEDINHWILFLSTKGIKELTLINRHETPLKLPTHLSSCVELKHLELYNCCFHPAPWFCGFPNLLSFDLHLVMFESCTCGEFVTQCPLLEILKIKARNPTIKVKSSELAKLENLNTLSLPLSMLGNGAITSSGIFQIFGFLSNLKQLALDFEMCKFLAEDGARKRVPSALQCLDTLVLKKIDFSSHNMVLCAFDLIRASPKLQVLAVRATVRDHVSPAAPCSWEVECGTIGQLQLRMVALGCIRGSKDELCFIKSLLSYSPMLQNMIIYHKRLSVDPQDVGEFEFARKLLKLHRASTIAEIDLRSS